ncbi:hypothetical protein Q5752_002196 [Cryptotrichosporon argae]
MFKLGMPSVQVPPVNDWDLIDRKDTLHVAPLVEAVAMPLFHRRKLWDAVEAYAHGLSQLLPWWATSLMMDAEAAVSSGLAEIEAVLWPNLSLTFLRFSTSERQYHTKQSLLRLAAICACIVMNMRYVPRRLIIELLRRKSEGSARLGMADVANSATKLAEDIEARGPVGPSRICPHEGCVQRHCCHKAWPEEDEAAT